MRKDEGKPMLLETQIEDLIKKALQEDAAWHDVTTLALIPEGKKAVGEIWAKEEHILAGMEVAKLVFQYCDPEISFLSCRLDGERIIEKECLVKVYGKARAILIAERTVLNFVQRLSGIATLTARYVQRAAPYGVEILDTRKTTAGWRELEKYAVTVGGGKNHRFSLRDAVLIKDNHLMLSESLGKAVAKAREYASPVVKIEVEVNSLEQVEEALKAKADIIMLDNMDLPAMEKAVKLIAKRALVEASGGVNLETVESIAACGVDFISVGALTHSAPAIDLSMRVVPG